MGQLQEERKIFLCYRRDDSAGDSGRLHDRLALEFGDKNIFMDVDSMRLGQDFVNRLTAEVQSCDALLAVIGPNWLDARDEEGNRRLDNPDDFVRIEIGAALQRDIPVIPILLNGTKIPRADKLPPELQKLARRSALDVRHGSFRSDTDRLIADLKQSPSTEPHSTQRPSAARPHSPVLTTRELFTNPKIQESFRDLPSTEPSQGTNPKLEELARLATDREQSASTKSPSNQGTNPPLSVQGDIKFLANPWVRANLFAAVGALVLSWLGPQLGIHAAVAFNVTFGAMIGLFLYWIWTNFR